MNHAVGGNKKTFRISPHKEKRGICGNVVFILVGLLVVGWFGFLLFYVGARNGNVLVNIPANVQKFEQYIHSNAHLRTEEGTSSTNVADVAKVSPYDSEGVHIVFSTDCEPFQDWQSLVLMHSAQTVGQKGSVTRIASGCSDEKRATLTEIYKNLYPAYHIHFTPNFKKDQKSGSSYHFYNKPYGLQHWLGNANPPVEDGTVIALLDPDMVLIRPITRRIKGLDNIIYNKKYVKPEDLPDRVKRGYPVAQLYGSYS